MPLGKVLIIFYCCFQSNLPFFFFFGGLWKQLVGKLSLCLFYILSPCCFPRPHLIL